MNIETIIENFEAGSGNYLEKEEAELLADCSYQSILEIAGDEETAQEVFWSAAQALAGFPDFQEFKFNAHGETPRQAAEHYLSSKD